MDVGHAFPTYYTYTYAFSPQPENLSRSQELSLFTAHKYQHA